MTALIVTALLSALSLALFSYSFPPWKIVLYGASLVLLSLCAGSFGFILSKKKGGKKPLIAAVIWAAGFCAGFSVITFLINNVLFNATRSADAAKILAAPVSVFFAALFTAGAKKSGKKVFPAALSVLLIALIGYSPLIPAAVTDYRIAHLEPAAAPKNLSRFTEKEYVTVNNADFYIAPDGSDENDGSLEKPFATFEKAKEAVRSAVSDTRKGVTVAVKAGEYRVNTVEFTAEDGGTEICPVRYCAYGDGEAILNGGVSLDPASFVKPDGDPIAERLSPEAADKVLCADLTAYGLTAEDWGKIYAIGSYNTAAKYDGDTVGGIYCELFVNDRRQTPARYPDSGWLYTEEVVATGLGRESDGALTAVENWDDIRNPASDVYRVDKALADRIASWGSLDDVWMFGFWKYDWADASSPIGSFSAEDRTLSPKYVSTYGTKTGAPYYFFNVPEELDAPGEWYLDRESGRLYLYPETDIAECSVDLSLSESPVILVNGADNLTFEGFTVKGTRGNAIEMTGNANTVKGCLIKNIAGTAVIVSGSDNFIFANEITRTGKGGISLNGGDRETLTPGNNRAENNLIHDWSEIYQTYQPAVSLGGVGNICTHNEIYNSPHEAITFGGNDNVIEYNLIHDVCLLSDDAGAIYAGRRWDCYGNVIRYNCIYDLGADGHKPCGIYLDDALSGETVFGNLLINVPSIGLHLGGGRDLDVRNNVLVNCNDRSVSYDQRAIDGVFGGWFTHSSQQGGDMWTNLFDSPWQTETWKKAYPQMQKFSDDFDNTDDPCFVPNPAFSKVTDNVIVNYEASVGDISEKAARFSTVENNYLFRLSEIEDVFTDPANGDYTFAHPFETVEDLPLSQIGRY